MDNQTNPSSQNSSPVQVQPVEQAAMAHNVAAALSYVLGFLTGIYFYVTSKDKFVRFHAMQSIMISVVFLVIDYILRFMFLIGFFLIPLVNLASLLLWLFLIYQAYKGFKYKLPVIGDFAEKESSK